MKNRWITLMVAIVLSTICWGQTYRLTEADKGLLKTAAVDKVERFQSNCRYIADVSLSSTQKQRAIKTALLDFVNEQRDNAGKIIQEDSKIIVTSLNGARQKPKKVKTYLNRLAFNLKDVYAYIDITYSDCHVASDFTRDPNNPDRYVGIVKVIQYFNAMTKEMIWKNDITEREVKVYATLTEIYSNNKTKKLWSIKLGDIEGTAIQ